MKNKVLFLMVILVLWGSGSLIFAANPSESRFVIATATNTDTTGHGNVKFQVCIGSDGVAFCILWSKYAYNQNNGYKGYRKWYKPRNKDYFATWRYTGGAANVGWPSTRNNMSENIQEIDIDGDGDLEVFVLMETSPKVWKVYCYKNLEDNK
jgi:hypothetical protein